MGVIKRMSSDKNEISLADTPKVLSAFRAQIEGSYVLQKFIKPRGLHAAVYRTTWRRNAPSSTMLVSCMKNMKISPDHPQARNHFCSNSSELDTNTVLSFRGRGATETQKICGAIVDYVENRSGQRRVPLPPRCVCLIYLSVCFCMRHC